jgi:hypothetical protein
MKPKKLRSLKLRKQTIASFNIGKLSNVKGGACTHDWSGCDTLLRPCCSVGLGWSCNYPIGPNTVGCSFPTCDTYCTYCQDTSPFC